MYIFEIYCMELLNNLCMNKLGQRFSLWSYDGDFRIINIVRRVYVYKGSYRNLVKLEIGYVCCKQQRGGKDCRNMLLVM